MFSNHRNGIREQRRKALRRRNLIGRIETLESRMVMAGDVPVFQNTEYLLAQNQPNGSIVAVVPEASDPDGPITYSLTSNNAQGILGFNPATRQITVVDASKLVRNALYTLSIRATDSEAVPQSTVATASVTITPPVAFDYGDAPSSYGSAAHALSIGPIIGGTVDYEPGSQFNINAAGDDFTGTDDEEGVTYAGGTFTVGLLNVPGEAYLQAWFDLNGDGDFADVGEDRTSTLPAGGRITADGTVRFAFTPTAQQLSDTSGRMYARFRASSWGGLSTTSGAPDGEVEDHRITLSAVDFGDASASYGTQFTAHRIGGGPRLGPTIDADSSAAVSVDAAGDGADEDGLTFTGLPIAGISKTLTANVENLTPNTGTARVQLWIDSNGDGSFLTGDTTFTEVMVTADATGKGKAFFTYTPSATPQFARIRVSSAGGLSAQGTSSLNSIAADGEMEDYLLTSRSIDYSDAPNLTVGGKTFAYGIASHVIGGPSLGTVNADEAAIVNDPTASGDTSDNGLTIPTAFADQSTTITANVVNASAITRLQAWADLNADGDFNDAGEMVYSQIVSSGAKSIAFTPTTAMFRNPDFAMLRVRIADAGANALAPTGAAGSGEVEDYRLTFGNSYDFSDSPLTPTGHIARGVTLGSLIDAEPSSSFINNAADGDDSSGIDDEDGVTYSTPIPGIPLTFTVAVGNLPTGHIARVTAYIDWNGDGDFNDILPNAAEKVYDDIRTANGTFTFTVPTTQYTNIANGLQTRFRVTSAQGTAPGTISSVGGEFNGEVEDYRIMFRTVDFGDLAAFEVTDRYDSANTTHGRPNSGAGPVLGSRVDGDSFPMPSIYADGDGDDDDGVTYPVLGLGQSAQITVTLQNVNGPTQLAGWLDLDNDGEFEPSERLLNLTATAAGNYTFNFLPTPFMASFPLGVAARFRTATGNIALAPTGAANDGEVEDYRFVIQTDGGDAWPVPVNGVVPLGYGTATTGNRMVGPMLGTLRDLDLSELRGGKYELGGPIDRHDAQADDSLYRSVSNSGRDDDEDGFTINNGEPLVIGTNYSGTITVSNLQAGGSYTLRGWADLNGDGDFNETGEITGDGQTADPSEGIVYRRAVVPAGSSASTILFSFTPTLAFANNPFMRFRVSDSSVLESTGWVSSGETEDYRLDLAVDLGDAPLSYGLVGNHPSGPKLGTLRDADPLAIASVNADGDDRDGEDDDDGLTSIGSVFAAPDNQKLMVGVENTLSISVSNIGPLGARVFAWLDLDGNGSFASGERLASKAIKPGETSTSFTLTPTTAMFRASNGQSYMRVRIVNNSATTTLNPDGYAYSGETEDYRLGYVNGKDYGDAPHYFIIPFDTAGPRVATTDSGFIPIDPIPGLVVYAQASHTAIGATLGQTIDTEEYQNYSDDEVDLDDEDGLTGPGPSASLIRVWENLVSTLTVNVQNIPAGSKALVKGWIDWNNNGSFEESGEEVLATNRSVNGSFTFTVKPTAAQRNGFQGVTYMRIRVQDYTGTVIPTLRSSDDLNGGSAPRGEVEDHRISVKAVPDVVIERKTDVIEIRDNLGSVSNNLSFVVEGTYLKVSAESSFLDDDPIIGTTGLTGVLGAGTNVVKIPLAQMNQKFRVNLKDGYDFVTFDSTGGNYFPAAGIEIVNADNGDALQISGPSNNTWNINGLNTGTVNVGTLGTLSFNGVSQLMGTESGDDDFKILDSASTGMYFSGRGGNDSFTFKSDGELLLNDYYLSVNDGRFLYFDGIEKAFITGGASSNVIDVSGWTGGGKIDGGGGTDTLKKHWGYFTDRPLTFFIAPTYAVTGDNMTIDIAGIEGVDFADMSSGGNAVFTANEWNGAAKFTGNDGTDKFTITRDFANAILSDTQFRIGTNPAMMLAGIEQAEVSGGANAQTVDFSAFSGAATFNGAGGIDTVSVNRDVNFDINPDAFVHGTRTVTLKNVESFKAFGNTGSNTFDVTDWNGTGTISGGGGTDLLIANLGDSKYAQADFELADARLKTTTRIDSVTSGATITLSSIENAILSGGLIANNFTLRNWSGSTDLDLGATAVTPDNPFPARGDGNRDTITVMRDVRSIIVNGDELSYDGEKRVLFKNLDIDPGATQDHLNLSGGASNTFIGIGEWYGSLSVDGGSGSDMLSLSGDRNFTVSDTSVEMSYLLGGDALVTSSFAIKNFELLDIIGGESNNRFTLNGFSGEGLIDGFGGVDEINVINSGSTTLEATRVLIGTHPFVLIDIDKTIITGRATDDRFTVNGWSGELDIRGEGGSDTLVNAGDVNFTLTDNQLTRSTPLTRSVPWNLDSIERAELTGGTRDNTFELSGWTGGGTFSGFTGNDRLIMSRDRDFTLTASSLTLSNGTDSQSFGTFNFEVAELNGGPSSNMIDARNFSGSVTISSGAGNDVVYGGSGADELNGGTGNDMLLGGGGNDLLRGDDGRDILIGGGGVDRLLGGVGDDLFIGGSTKYDNDRNLLDALLAAWTNTTNNYVDRITKIRDTGFGPSSEKLNATTVYDDALTDILTGGADRDWFFGEFTVGQPGLENPTDDDTTETLTDLN